MRNYFRNYPHNFKYVAVAQGLFCMGFFSLKSLFVLYALRRFNISQAEIFPLNAMFMALCYATSFLGGFIADNIISPRQTLICGGILTTIGMGLFCVSHLEFLYAAMAFISLGTGLFKPNFSTAISLMFDDPANELKKAAFSKLYVAMNVGSLIGILVISVLDMQNIWYYNLVFVAISFILSAAAFYKMPCELRLSYTKIKPGHPTNHKLGMAIIIATLVIIYAIFKNIESSDYIMSIIMMITIIWYLYILYVSNKSERYNLLKLFFYYGLFIISCALFEQVSSSLMIFINTQVDRQFFGITLPSSLFMATNPTLILVFSILLPYITKLNYKKYCTTNLAKFVIGYGFLCLSFGILALRDQYFHQESTSFIWILASFSLQTVAEWSIVPVGFAIAANYAPARYLGLLISFWLTGIAYGHLLAGKLANWSVESSDGKISRNYGQFFTDLMLLSGTVFIMLLLIQFGLMLIKQRRTLSSH